MRYGLVEVIRERAVTGKLKLNKRPEGRRIAELTAAGVCHIVALKLDRLFRNAVDALAHVEEWEQARISLHLVDMGGQSINTGFSMGKMLVTMLAGFAEFERNMIAERTTAALNYKKAHGEVYNHVPFGMDRVGYTLDAKGRPRGGSLVPNATEQGVIARMATLRAQGVSYNEIANALNADNVPTKNGCVWRSQTIKNTLASAA